MSERDWLAERFEQQRDHLRAVAYRMLGSLPEAEDAVQDAWLRVSRADTGGVENLAGWLTTVTARICLDALRARRARREQPMLDGVPEPVAAAADPAQEAELADSVGLAMLVVLETLALSILNHDSAIASAAARMVTAAAGRPLIEMGSRRTHEAAAVACARAAYLAGFASTSNLEAERRFGIPTAGTAAHAWVLLHDDELSAFESQVKALGPDTTLLVDTYDIRRGVEASRLGRLPRRSHG